MNKNLYSVMIVLGAVLWGMISLFSTPLKENGIYPSTIVTIRSFGAVILLWIVFGIKDRKLLKINIKDIWIFAGTGIISFTFFNWCYFIALEQTTTAVAVVLLYTSPIFIIILSAILFKEKITKLKIVALVMTVVGCACVAGLVGGRLNGSAVGLLCGLGSGLFYGLYSIFGRYGLNKYSSITVTIYTFLFAAIASVFIVDFSQFDIVLNNSTVLINSGLLVVVSTVLPFLLYTKGLSGVETGIAAILATIEPVVGVIVGFTIFGEEPNLIKITGIALVIGASVILNIRSK
jgi:hypothetical protein